MVQAVDAGRKEGAPLLLLADVFVENVSSVEVGKRLASQFLPLCVLKETNQERQWLDRADALTEKLL